MAHIEKGSQSVQKFVTLSHVLKHFDQTKLQRKTADVHVAFQVSPALLAMWSGTGEGNGGGSASSKDTVPAWAMLSLLLKASPTGVWKPTFHRFL